MANIELTNEQISLVLEALDHLGAAEGTTEDESVRIDELGTKLQKELETPFTVEFTATLDVMAVDRSAALVKAYAEITRATKLKVDTINDVFGVYIDGKCV